MVANPGGEAWTFTESGTLRLILVPNPGSNGTYTDQCYAASLQALRFDYAGSRQDETLNINLSPFVTGNTVVNHYPPECPDYYLTGFDATLELGLVGEGDQVRAEHFRQGESTGFISGPLAIPDDLWNQIDGVWHFYVGSIGALQRLEGQFTPDTLVVTADPDSLAAGGEAGLTVEAAGLPGETLITLSLDEPSLGSLVVGGGPAALKTASLSSVQVTLAEMPSVRFVAAETVPDSAVVVTITANSEDGRDGAFEITILPLPTVQFLSVMDVDYGHDFVMVSRFPPNERLPDGDDFDNGDFHETPAPDLPTATASGPDAGDQYTVRPSLAFASSFGDGVRCRAVHFRLGVVRDGQPVEFSDKDGEEDDGSDYYEYGSEWHANLASAECRADDFIRFVANGPPSAAGADGSPGTPSSPAGTYDDEHEGRQTVRVELGDTVELRAVAQRDGAEVESERATYTVGRESGLLWDPEAQADVFVQWATRPGTTAAPEVVTERMSEDLAQAAVRLRLGNTTPYVEVQNAIGLTAPLGGNAATWRPSAPGTVGVSLVLTGLSGGPDVTITGSYLYQTGDGLDVIANRLLNDLAVNSNGRIRLGENASTGFPHHALRTSALLIARGEEVLDVTATHPGSEVGIGRYTIDYGRLVGPMVRMTAMNFQDGDPSTLDVIEVEENVIYGDEIGAVPLSGASFGYGDSDLYPSPWANTVLLDQRAADSADDLPHVAGHEVAHVLLNEHYPGAAIGDHSCRQPEQHDSDSTNLVACAASAPLEGYDSQKRLKQEQALNIRTDHAPVAGAPPAPARLLRPFDAAQRLATKPR